MNTINSSQPAFSRARFLLSTLPSTWSLALMNWIRRQPYRADHFLTLISLLCYGIARSSPLWVAGLFMVLSSWVNPFSPMVLIITLVIISGVNTICLVEKQGFNIIINHLNELASYEDFLYELSRSRKNDIENDRLMLDGILGRCSPLVIGLVVTAFDDAFFDQLKHKNIKSAVASNHALASSKPKRKI